MKRMKLVILCEVVVALMIVASVLDSCQSPTAGPTTKYEATIQIDTVAADQVESSNTARLYGRMDVEWGLQVNVACADSLAGWFAQSQFNIEDMWIPSFGPICLRTYNTFNFVYVRFAQPDTLIYTLGFVPASSPGPCFPTWRHYRFIWPTGGF
jgi:hypothetical protein